MSQNPLLPTNTTPQSAPAADQAANVIRDKLQRLYAEEPAASTEAREAELATHRSKHQQYMHKLSESGMDLAAIQTAWHNYYIGLPDTEKHEVWQEFYASNTILPTTKSDAAQSSFERAEAKHQVSSSARRERSLSRQRQADNRSPRQIQSAIRQKVSANGALGVKQHVQSLAFGLGMGALVIFVFLFSFFNQVIIAPFIEPSSVAAATPIIVNTAAYAASSTPEVIIPKINVEIPIDYSETSTNESVIENDLQQGVVHYPTTVFPGQQGNAAFFGHSSNNIFNQGKYKFAFVLLHTLVPGDTFYLSYHGTVYVYSVVSKKVVPPSDVSVLGPIAGQTATATLITCDPPGTSINRLIVVGKQISPDPANDSAAASSLAAPTVATTLPGNGPSLWSRVMSTLLGKVIGIVVIIGLAGLVIYWVNSPRRLAR